MREVFCLLRVWYNFMIMFDLFDILAILAMMAQINIQHLSLDTSFPYLSQKFRIAFKGNVLNCYPSDSGIFVIVKDDSNGNCSHKKQYCSVLRYDWSGKVIAEHSTYEDKQPVFQHWDQQGHPLYEQQKKVSIIGATMIREDEFIYESCTLMEKNKQSVNVSAINVYSFTKQTQNVKYIKQQNWRQDIWYETFPGSQKLCVIQCVVDQQEEISSSYVRLSYYDATLGKFAMKPRDIATFGMTCYQKEIIVKCYQLDSQSKIGWVTEDEKGKIVCHIVSLEDGETILQKINVSCNYSNTQIYRHFWLPLLQISQQKEGSVYMMAYMQKQYECDNIASVLEYCVCILNKGKITVQKKYQLPKKHQNARILHQRAWQLPGQIIYVQYRQVWKWGDKKGQSYTFFIDLSRNTITEIPKQMNSLRESVYAHPEAKGVAVLNWLVQDQQLYRDEEDEEGKTAVRATVYFPNLHIKDIYMELLLGVNEDFDDDLLHDAMALLAE